MRKFFFSLMAAFVVALSANAATSVWSGEYEFGAEGDGWQEVTAEAFADLQLGDALVVTVSAITNPDGWAQINLAGRDPWTVVPGTNWGDVKVGASKYVIDDEALLASIKSGGLGVQGKFYVLTDISIECEGETPDPTPGVLTSVWSGEYEFGAEGDGWQEVAAEAFADLQLGDALVVTVSAITNPDGWAQINLAGKEPWTVVPGTNWGDVKVGASKYVIDDEALLASIKSGGLGVQGKFYVLTDISIETVATDGITSTSVSTPSDACYSILGTRVARSTRGIVVRNGKTFFVK